MDPGDDYDDDFEEEALASGSTPVIFVSPGRRPHRVFGWEEREDLMMTIFC